MCGRHHHHLVVTLQLDGWMAGDHQTELSWKLGKLSPGAVLPQDISVLFICLLRERIQRKNKSVNKSVSV